MERDKLYRLLRLGLEKGASDIHFQVGYLPLYRFHGELVELRFKVLTPHDTEEIVKHLLASAETDTDLGFNERDIAFDLPGEGRFRVNISRQRRSFNIGLRVIPLQIKAAADLNLPSVVGDIANLRRGYVLVTGATGMGKSTTLATMINEINRTRKAKIVTIEDPIEFVFTHDKSIITQREIGTDTASFPDALRAALRQDPDVIMVGEMRDLETTSFTITAAETGHLVFSTLHTVHAPQTIERIVDIYPANQQNQIRTMLANTLQAVISQTLFKRSDKPGMIPCTEILLCTSATRNCIRENRIFEIPNIIETSRRVGMQSLDHSIAEMFFRGHIDREEAIIRSSNPIKMEKLLVEENKARFVHENAMAPV